MNIQLDDSKIEELVLAEIRKSVDRKIEYVMNNGCANWFTQDNIKRVTYAAVKDMLDEKIIANMVNNIDKEKFIACFSEKFAETLYNNFIG